ncbi:hypothetical protein BOM_1448 (plasmid) [Borrelia miyamotoi FR64b]|uniref:Uncharacterized protein n=1 Tax=Borrelia miyamotoi FR64b TaxID=1292392 RepID=W5SLN1_9SPIR|nr:hypothetical protein BOM_1448 [Borrelia miyamotoi FR64b]
MMKLIMFIIKYDVLFKNLTKTIKRLEKPKIGFIFI